jgi:hypothetical protein
MRYCDMPKRSRKEVQQQIRRDANQSAFDAIQRIIDQTEGGVPPLTPEGKNQFAVTLGRRGGLKGGKARAANLTAAERRKSAMKAARARWAKKAGR